MLPVIFVITHLVDLFYILNYMTDIKNLSPNKDKISTSLLFVSFYNYVNHYNDNLYRMKQTSPTCKYK